MNERPDEALPALEATVALKRRYWPRNEGSILIAQSGLASGLAALGRHDEALVLKREIYTRRVATLGVSHETTLLDGNNLAISLTKLELWDESITLQRDQLLPAARRSLGANHNETLKTNQNLAVALYDNAACTRDDLRLNQHDRAAPHFRITGDDLLEAASIMQDVVQRRRRVFGPAHPATLNAEDTLSMMRERLADV